MKNDSKFLSPATIFLVAGHLFSACAASPEESSPGTCTLNCSKKRVGAIEFGARPLYPSSGVTLPCSLAGATAGIAPHNGPVQVRYLVYETLPNFSKLPDTSGGAAGGGGGASTSANLDLSKKSRLAVATGPKAMLQDVPLAEIVPKAGIGFEPVLFGSMSIEKTNEEFKTSPTEASPFKFAGVVTPSSEWCTDSCGVATFEFWPNCITGGQTIQSSIFIQNIAVKSEYTFTLTPF